MSDTRCFNEEMEQCAGDAALYVLGTLAPEKASAFEQRLRSGCPLCAAQADHYAVVAERLPLAIEPVQPRPELRQRLLDLVQPRVKPDSTVAGMKIVRRDEAPWVKLPVPGVEIRPLIRDKSGTKTLMLRMQPGAVFPQHDHPVPEQCYVLEGTVTDSDGITLSVGDFIVMPGGIKHEPIRTETGCTLFIAYAA